MRCSTLRLECPVHRSMKRFSTHPFLLLLWVVIQGRLPRRPFFLTPTRLKLDQSPLRRQRHHLGPARNLEYLQDARHVRLDRTLGSHVRPGDLLVVPPAATADSVSSSRWVSRCPDICDGSFAAIPVGTKLSPACTARTQRIKSSRGILSADRASHRRACLRIQVPARCHVGSRASTSIDRQIAFLAPMALV